MQNFYTQKNQPLVDALICNGLAKDKAEALNLFKMPCVISNNVLTCNNRKYNIVYEEPIFQWVEECLQGAIDYIEGK